MEPASWTAIGTAATIGSSVFSAFGAISDARNQAAISDYNAQVADADAKAAQIAGDYEAERLAERHKKFLAAQRAAAGAAGVTMEGAPALLAADSAAEMKLDELALRYSTTVQAARQRAQAAADRLQARATRAAGFGAAGRSLLTGARELAGMFE